MSVFKQNPFLAGFGAVMLVGVGGLGYLAYSAMDDNAKARHDYDEANSKLKGLQSSQLYPDEANFKKVEKVKMDVQAKMNGLQKGLADQQIKVEPISASVFQDKLKETVNALTDRGAEARVKFPGNERDRDREKFYFGFDAYKATQPKPEAAPVLYRELKAIDAVVGLILDAKNTDVLELTRPEVNEEKDGKPAAADPSKKKNAGEAAAKVVSHETFTIRFLTTANNFQSVLNKIVGYKQQIFVVHGVTIKNQVQEPPSKVSPATPNGAPAPVAPPPPPTPGTPPTPPAPGTPAPGTPATPAAETPAAPVPEAGPRAFVFGKELVEATLKIEIVDVQPPAALPVEKSPAKK